MSELESRWLAAMAKDGELERQADAILDRDRRIIALAAALRRQIDACDGDCVMCDDARAAITASEGVRA